MAYDIGNHILWADEEGVVVKYDEYEDTYSIWNFPDAHLYEVVMEDELEPWAGVETPWPQKVMDLIGAQKSSTGTWSVGDVVKHVGGTDGKAKLENYNPADDMWLLDDGCTKLTKNLELAEDPPVEIINEVATPSPVSSEAYQFEVSEYVHVLYHGNGMVTMQYQKDGNNTYRVQLDSGNEMVFLEKQIEVYNPSEDETGKELPKGAFIKSFELPSNEDWVPEYGDKVKSKTGKYAEVAGYYPETGKVKLFYEGSYKASTVLKKGLTLVAQKNPTNGAAPGSPVKDKTGFKMPSGEIYGESPMKDIFDDDEDEPKKFKPGDKVLYINSDESKGVVLCYQDNGKVQVEWTIPGVPSTSILEYDEELLKLDELDAPAFKEGDEVRIGQSQWANIWGIIGMEAVVQIAPEIPTLNVSVLVKHEKYPNYQGGKGPEGKKGSLTSNFGLPRSSLTLLP